MLKIRKIQMEEKLESRSSEISVLRDHLCVCKIQLNQHTKTFNDLLDLISQTKDNNKGKQTLGSCLIQNSPTSPPRRTDRQIKRDTLLDEMKTLVDKAIHISKSHPLANLDDM